MDSKLLSELYQRPQKLLEPWVPHLRESMVLADIKTDLEIAHYLSQLGHESGGFKFTAEIWGPTKQQLRYERNFGASWGPRSRLKPETWINSLAFTLGNSEKGDGFKFRGMGLIQVTGRTNTQLANRRLSLLLGTKEVPQNVFMTKPELLRSYRLACLSAADYWNRRNLNQYAGFYDSTRLTKAINGGYNGLAHRQLLFNRFFLLNKG